MTLKTHRTLYWVFTILLALMLIADGFGGITRQQAGQDVLRHLGYPMYLLTIAGIAITFISAFASRAFVGDNGFELIFPLIMLAFMFVPYWLWKKIRPSL